jgi:hypothetical protein
MRPLPTACLICALLGSSSTSWAETPTLDQIRDQYLESLKIFECFEATGESRQVRFTSAGNLKAGTTRSREEFARDGVREVGVSTTLNDQGEGSFVEWRGFDGTFSFLWHHYLIPPAGQLTIPSGARKRGPKSIFAECLISLLQLVGDDRSIQSLRELWSSAPASLLSSSQSDAGEPLILVRFGPHRGHKWRWAEPSPEHDSRSVHTEVAFNAARGMLPQSITVITVRPDGSERKIEHRVTAFRTVMKDGRSYFVPEAGVSPRLTHVRHEFRLDTFNVVTSVDPQRFRPQFPEATEIIERQADGSYKHFYPGPGGQEAFVKRLRDMVTNGDARDPSQATPLRPTPDPLFVSQGTPRADGVTAEPASPNWSLWLGTGSIALLAAGSWLWWKHR